MNSSLARLVAGAIFSLLLLAAASSGAVFGFMHRDRMHNIETAEGVVRTLTERWQYADVEAAFQPSVAATVDRSAAQVAFNRLSRLGGLRTIGEPEVSNYSVRYFASEGLTRKTTLNFGAHFERGEATVTITLVTTDGVTKVQHLNIKPIRIVPSSSQRSIA